MISFGGPAGQIALMHRELVEERQWVEEGAFLRALNVCHLLPGPEAQQLATWIGWRMHGTIGGLVCGLLFVLPGAAIMLGLSMLYAFAADLKPVAALFLGIKAAVLAIVVQALIRIARRALDSGFKRALAFAAFLALFLFNLPFPLVVLGSGAIGFLLARVRPDWLHAHGKAANDAPVGPLPWAQTLRSIAIWIAIWAAPMLAILLAHSSGTFPSVAAIVLNGPFELPEAVQQLMAGLDGIENRIDPGAAADKNLYDLPPQERGSIPEVAGSLKEALDALDADRAFLKKGGVMDDDFIDAYIELKMEEVARLQLHPHPVEFDMYYSC